LEIAKENPVMLKGDPYSEDLLNERTKRTIHRLYKGYSASVPQGIPRVLTFQILRNQSSNLAA
jgi:hypothetical protein